MTKWYVNKAQANDQNGRPIEITYYITPERERSNAEYEITEIARFGSHRQAQDFLMTMPELKKPVNEDMVRLPGGRMTQFNRVRGDLWTVTALDGNRVVSQVRMQIESLDAFKAGLLAAAEGRGQYWAQAEQILGG